MLLESYFEQIDASKVCLKIADANAHYPIVIDPLASQQAYLKASNTEGHDQFGTGVAVSGNTVAVGADAEDGNGVGINADSDFDGIPDSQDSNGFPDANSNGIPDFQENNDLADSGAVYIFVRTSNGWAQQAYLKASNAGAGDAFGHNLDLDGDILVVGAWLEDSNATGVTIGSSSTNDLAPSSGAAYVFERNDSGVWKERAYLKASNTGSSDGFGFSVAVSRHTVVVGAQGEDSDSTGVGDTESQAGAAYVFERVNETWQTAGMLKLPTRKRKIAMPHVSMSGKIILWSEQLEKMAMDRRRVTIVYLHQVQFMSM